MRDSTGVMSTIGVRAAVLCVCISAAVPTARGQQPGQPPRPPIGALDHTVWTIRDGAPSGVQAMAQSVDGALWVGALTGLYRFDGVRFEAFEPPASQPLPSLSVSALLALPDSTLWIGYNVGGASVLARGRVVSFSQRDGLPEGTVTAFARDSAGNLWAATTSGLARLRDGRWQRIGAESGYPGGMTPDLLVDRRGALWAPTKDGVFILPRGARRFVRQAPSLDPAGGGVGIPREAPDGSVWGASTTLGLTRLADSAGRATPAQPVAERLHEALGLSVDRHGNAWVMSPAGLVRVPLVSTHATGPVSGGTPRPLPVERVPLTTGQQTSLALEDREGNVWVGTEGGLERFRETKLTPVLLSEPISGPSLAPAASGAVWLGRYSRPPLTVGDRVVSHAGGPADISCAYRDLDGGVWFGNAAGIWHVPAGASPSSTPFTRVPLPDEAGPGDVQAIARSLDGDLWVSIRGGRRKGVFRRHGTAWSLAPVPPELSDQIALTVVADSAGRVWLGYVGNRLVLATGDSVRLFSDGDGLHVGSVTALLVRGPRVWIGGESGLTMLGDGRFRPVNATESLRGITGIVETADGDVWVNGVGGVTHIPATEVRRTLQDPAYRARAQRFDYRDGLNGQAPQVRPLPTAIEGTDGRLWFATATGVAWLDPRNIKRNRVPPPIQIRAVRAAGKGYDVGTRVTLPERTTELQVAYTALGLAMPDRVRFRYRLSGVDTAWADAGTRREAFYTNLGPGRYQFQVIAANEDDVWNEAGASLELVIPPTFTQTRAFVALLAAAGLCAVWLLARWRQRQLARALRAQFEGQLAERARVARELHDTLLSDLAGVAMQLNAGVRRAETSGGADATIVELLSTLSAQVRHSLVEARRSVTAMRTQPPDASPPLHAQLVAAARRTFAETEIAAHVEYVGSPRPYPPAVEAEIVGLATEAMTNARRHADCRTVAVTCRYASRELRVRVRDDGRGFDPSRPTPTGHWGLVGMRERAASIGAALAVKSAPGAGTEVVLVVPRRRAPRTRLTGFAPPEQV
jgi:signal transduction histidine kinase/ligand-binding sensor domain-containing protein